jgi:GAF domain-containing protein
MNPAQPTDQSLNGDAPGADLPATPAIGQLEQSVPGRLLDLLVETTDLRELLYAVTELAVETIPGCRSASVTVAYEREPATVASSDPEALAVDQAQYAAREGPCLLAARTDDIVQVNDVADADIPGPWREAALAVGFNAVLSVPIASDSNVAAGLNVYAGRSGWSPEAVDAADLLAAYTGDAITLAYRINRRNAI